MTQDFDAIYILDLGGNVRKNPKLSGTTHNVFGIQVGASINILVRNRAQNKMLSKKPALYYAATQTEWRREQKCLFLDEKECLQNIEWQSIEPDANHTWLQTGLNDEYSNLICIGNREAKAQSALTNVIFSNYSRGAETTRDNWLYNYSESQLVANVRRFIDFYNQEVSELG